tara:strand:- start:1063 stop:1320 length:258 start_codon:yes stop_codon:yes gene_type:complete
MIRINQNEEIAAFATQEALKQKFDALTQFMDNWKDPIVSVINAKDYEIMNEACTHFTGSTLKIESRYQNNLILVSADGYYKAVGA